VIDLHFHVLPGIDDGPSTLGDALALAAAAQAGGTTTVVATPHVSLEYRNGAQEIGRLVGELDAHLQTAGIALEVRTGAEVATTVLADLPDGELSRLTLAGGRWLLLEPPFAAVLGGFEEIVAGLQRKGFGVVLAHPERCRGFHRDPQLLERLVRSGALVSITAGSLDGRFGAPVRRFSHDLMRAGLVHNVASDAHDQRARPPSLAGELERAGLLPLADWLMRAVPEAILTGLEIPTRPRLETVPAAHPRWSRRWRRTH
jgi:protein-tyrosine phosphatase